MLFSSPCCMCSDFMFNSFKDDDHRGQAGQLQCCLEFLHAVRLQAPPSDSAKLEATLLKDQKEKTYTAVYTTL